jgi:putative phosphoribosyl transferase
VTPSGGTVRSLGFGEKGGTTLDGFPITELVSVVVPGGTILGDLTIPKDSVGTVVFAHGSGSGRSSPRNRSVARDLERSRVATLLIDLLTEEEAQVDAETRRYRFDIPRLSERLISVVDSLSRWRGTSEWPVGLYGASTGGAAALLAAAARPDRVRALVLRGARSDLAGPSVARVRAPTLFLVGALDPEIRTLNEETRAHMAAPTELHVIPRASHLFEEPGALEEVSRQTREWFLKLFLPSA